MKRFISLLREQAKSDPLLFQPILGARDMLRVLEHKPDVAVALATGAWRESAELKLSMAGFNTSHIPIATSGDEVSRRRIMMLAEVRARERCRVGTFVTKIYVGDGVWDFETARELGYEFIGVASDERAPDLRKAGAIRIVPDFSEGSDFLEHLETIWNAQKETQVCDGIRPR